MKLPRRRFVQLAASAVALPAIVHNARADAYPSRPVHIILGFPPGGTSDIIGRLMAQWLSDHFGQPFVFDYHPGAGSNIGAEIASRADPDGYTILMSTSANAINTTLYKNLKFNILTDFEPVAGLFRVPNVLEVNPSVPVHTVPEFIAYAEAHPDKLDFASGGIGATQHLSAELFMYMTHIKMQHVPYRGSTAALLDLVSGRVQVMFDLLPTSRGYIKSGKLRGLAVTTTTRSPALPDLPTIAEFVPGYEFSTWNGFSVPKNTPPAIVEKLNKAINTGLADPQVQAQLRELGASELTGSSADFGKLFTGDVAKWGTVIRAYNINVQ